MADQTNYYDRLGLPENASQEEIRKAFREAARRLHPDVNVEPGATEMFIKVKEAYEVLIDPSKRATYDGEIHHEDHPPPPVVITTHFSRPALLKLAEEQLLYALIEMKVQLDELGDDFPTPPANIALVLDCSTSMQGPRLDIVKATSIELIRQLKAEDFLSIIAFNDRAEVVLPAAQYAHNHKSEGRIRTLQTAGGTENFQGLYAGLAEINRHLNRRFINHMILITDGHTYGDEKSCKELAQRAAKEGIGISCLGIGSNWNDAFLDEIARITGGSCFYVKHPKDTRELLHQIFDALSQVYIERAKFNFRIGHGVQLNYAFRIHPETGVLSIVPPLQLGHIPVQSGLKFLLEFLVHPLSPDVDHVLLAEGTLTFDIPKHADITYRVPITLVRPTQERAASTPPPPVIMDALSRLTLYRMQEQTKKELKLGHYEKATKRLQYMAANLLAKGEQELAKTVLTEVNHVEKHKKLSTEGEKRIKYGTRALINLSQRKSPGS